MTGDFYFNSCCYFSFSRKLYAPFLLFLMVALEKQLTTECQRHSGKHFPCVFKCYILIPKRVSIT